MLGSDLMAVCKKFGIEAEGFDLPELDICNDLSALDRIAECDAVVNCAAYTDVDRAEDDMEAAYAVNCDGASNISAWCEERDIPVVYISTDYVFYGLKGKSYKEDDPVSPRNMYGDSKLAGELAIRTAYENHIIVRTQSLFVVNGKNFVKSIIALLEKDKGPLKVVNDQVSSPTYTVHLAEAILHLMQTEKRGIVHVAASESCSWHGFACEIAKSLGSDTEIMPVPSSEYERRAKRPECSVLDTGLYTEVTGHTMPTWKEGLKEYLVAEGWEIS